MNDTLLTPDRVALLMSLVPYLRANGPTSITELAENFGAEEATLRRLVAMLATSGVPGETKSYQHEDLFDIDWDAFERDDVVTLTRTVAIEATPRFANREASALLAGLHRLMGLLGPEDAMRAEALAARLRDNLPEAAAVLSMSVSTGENDPRIRELVSAIEQRLTAQFTYTNQRHEIAKRAVVPLHVFEQGNDWYLRAWCLDRAAERTFRLDHIEDLQIVREEVSTVQEGPVGVLTGSLSSTSSEQQVIYEIRVLATERALALIRRFAPEVIGVHGDGRTFARVEAWNESTAVRLVAQAGGELQVLDPPAARAAVAAWARRALEESGST